MFACIRRLCAVAICLSVVPAFGEGVERVGDWGDPACISVAGATTFTPESIARSLQYDFATMTAAKSKAPLDKYLETLTNRVTEGYRHAGFPNAKATVEPQGYRQTKLIVSIEEGPRFRCGGIVVKKPGDLVSSQLIEWLTTKQPPANAFLTGFEQTSEEHVACWCDRSGQSVKLQKPIWQQGEPAHFDDASVDFLKSQIARALADLGYPWADFEIAQPTDADQQTADLQITINDLGPAAIIGAVTVEGNSRDSTEEILDYLKVPLGASMSESARSQVWYKLWMSGRYLRHDVELVPPPERGGIVELHIIVKEYEKATALGKPLNQAEAALMKCREWMLDGPHRGDDWVVTFPEPSNARAIVSPKYGALVCGAPTLAGDQPCRFAAALTPLGLLYASSASNAKIAVPLRNVQFYGNIGFGMADDDDDKDHRFRFMMGAGLSMKDDDDDGPLARLSISISPAAMLSFAHEHEATWKIDDGVLSIDMEGSILKVETETGRLIQLSAVSDDGDRAIYGIGLEQGAFEREFAKADEALDHQFSRTENQFAPDRPLTSFVSALVEDETIKRGVIEWLDAQERLPLITKAQQVAEGALKVGILRPLDDKLVEYMANLPPKDEEFVIPDISFGNVDSFTSFVFYCSRYVMGSDDFFPRGSSPSGLLKYLAATYVHRADDDELGATVVLKDFGPLQHLFTAAVCVAGGRERNAEYLAWLVADGLSKLENSNLAAEVKSLIAPDKLSGKCVQHLASVLRDMNEQDVAALGELLFAERGKLLTDAARWLREHKEARLDVLIPVVLDTLWTAGLKSVVEERLHALEPKQQEPGPAKELPTEEVL